MKELVKSNFSMAYPHTRILGTSTIPIELEGNRLRDTVLGANNVLDESH